MNINKVCPSFKSNILQYYSSQPKTKTAKSTTPMAIQPAIVNKNKTEKKSFKKYLPYILAASTIAFTSALYIVSRKRPPMMSNEMDKINGAKFKSILNNLLPENYDSSKIFKANLHIHSKMSDGKLSPAEILEQAYQCSMKLPENEKFYFSMTDHDNIDGLKIVSDLIKQNLEKYSKLVFVPGVELSVKYINPQTLKAPMNLDFLIYGFDIDNPKLIEVLKKQKDGILKNTKSVFEELNKLDEKLGFSVEEMQNSAEDAHLRYIGSNGYLKSLNKYITEKINEVSSSAINKKDEIINKCFGNTKYCFGNLIELQDAIKLTKDMDAASFLAHPGKFNFKGPDGPILKTEGTQATNQIFKDFNSYGGDGIEYHYQAYKEGNVDWWNRIKNAYEELKLNLSKSGGYDTHTESILKH